MASSLLRVAPPSPLSSQASWQQPSSFPHTLFRSADYSCAGVHDEKRSRIRCYLDQNRASSKSSASDNSTEEDKGKVQQATPGDTYAHGSSYERGYLKVSNLHTIYYEIFGNPVGNPVVFLHGGPGAGCVPRHACFFDPRHYRIVLFDQRGCGKSSPRGCLEENTTWDLVEDIEKLRKHLRVNKWMVMGGSWGVTLALAYSQTYPDAVSALILRGVCMLRQEEIDWFYKQGANSLFPFAWDQLLSVLEPSEHGMVLPAFYQRLTSNDAELQLQAAQAWLRWEMGLSFFSISPVVYSWDGRQYLMDPSQEGPGKKQKPTQKDRVEEPAAVQGQASGTVLQASASNSQKIQSGTRPASQNSGSDERKIMPSQLAQARLECHYFIHGGFLRENQLLEDISRIRHIPCVIIQGRYDFVCPLKNAFDLHRAWPDAELYIVSNAGHSMYEKGITRQLVSATERFKSLKY